MSKPRKMEQGEPILLGKFTANDEALARTVLVVQVDLMEEEGKAVGLAAVVLTSNTNQEFLADAWELLRKTCIDRLKVEAGKPEPKVQ